MADEIPDEEKSGAPERLTNARKEGEEDVSGHVVTRNTGDDSPSGAPERFTNAKDEDDEDVSGHVVTR
jgi:hypothetical protein